MFTTNKFSHLCRLCYKGTQGKTTCLVYFYYLLHKFNHVMSWAIIFTKNPLYCHVFTQWTGSISVPTVSSGRNFELKTNMAFTHAAQVLSNLGEISLTKHDSRNLESIPRMTLIQSVISRKTNTN